ncbi:MAG: MarR family transcriptional regulator [Spirochaetota bacterium]
MSQPVTSADITHDHELDVLSQIHHNQAVKQRDIAHAIGLSLGMTNAILKRLAGKGFISMRKINARTIHYLVTPDGIDLIARRSYRYLRRTVGHVVRYKERLLELFDAAAAAPPTGPGAERVVLAGESDLAFLVEWCAEKTGLAFEQLDSLDEAEPADGAFVVASERLPLAPVQPPWDLHLADLVVQGR